MRRRKIVAANWKMNTLYPEAIQLIQQIAEQSKQVENVTRVVFPPFPFIHAVVGALQNETRFDVGAQNCSQFSKGAYTGEVSCAMIRSAGGKFVLVGHSERRLYFKESNADCVAKINQALESDLTVIFCFGEQLSERKSNTQFETVKQQLEEVLRHFPTDKINHLILAYEPVWAIGTGETASPEQAQEMHAYVRMVLADLFSPEHAQAISILYGGSCNAQNAKELFSCKDVDGGLIGGASLKADDFCKIIASFS